MVDLASNTFLDAGGISVLLHAQHEARRAGRHLRITNPQHPTVRQVLDITGTLGVLAELGRAPDDEADDLEPLDEDEEHDRAR